MTTLVAEKKPCIKCDKGNGIMMCHGCQQSFCIKHILSHREDLSLQMDKLGQEHDLLYRDLSQDDNNTHPLLAQINKWEIESIAKIQITAETARIILRKNIAQNRSEIKMEMNKITEDLRLSRESIDYTEIELEKWSRKLQELRQSFDKNLDFDIIEDEDLISSVRLIKIRESFPSFDELWKESHSTNHELFDQVVGPIMLSDNNYLATCSELYYNYSSCCGQNSYHTGVHQIRFRIENMTVNNLFFGIVTSSQAIVPRITRSSSSYGWWSLEWMVVSGKEQCISKDNHFSIGDEISLMLNCDNRQIQLKHHRTKRVVQLFIDLRRCPLPWKILVSLPNRNDCVRILQ